MAMTACPVCIVDATAQEQDGLLCMQLAVWEEDVRTALLVRCHSSCRVALTSWQCALLPKA